MTSDATYGGLGKAVAMNAYRNGILEALSLVGWFANCTRFQTFVRSLYVSNKDHEEWYGDRKTASEMEKDDLERKMHFNLKFFNVRASKLNGICANYKQILKQARPDWPKMLELVTKSPMILNFKKVGLRAKDVETIAYMLAENPYGAS